MPTDEDGNVPVRWDKPLSACARQPTNICWA